MDIINLYWCERETGRKREGKLRGELARERKEEERRWGDLLHET